MSRTFPRPIKRLVVKIGSSLIANYRFKPERARLLSLVQNLSQLNREGIEVVLVSSGAIVLGFGALGEKERPQELALLQARAAIGQTILMRTYSDLFKKNKTHCAQVLLTWDDFDNRQRYNNARQTFLAILNQRVIPVVNENDTISTDEIKFGDNDKLSALVAALVSADLLVILTDVEGFYDKSSESKKVFNEIREVTDEIKQMATGTQKKHVARGGMSAKLDAIKVATHANVPCVIASGQEPDILTRILSGEQVGTLFVEKEDKVLLRKHWICFSSKPKGSIVVDQGAKQALVKRGVSLLLPGVVSWHGDFQKNDVVTIVDQQGDEIARGVINYSLEDLLKIKDRRGKQEVVHCDNLALVQQ